MTIDDSIKEALARLRWVRARSIAIYGKHNYNRISSYPRIGSIKHEGTCFKCKREGKLLHFDDDTHLCENCASESGLLEFA